MLSRLTLKFKILLLSCSIVMGLSTLAITAYLQIHSHNVVVDETAAYSQRRSAILVEIQGAAINFKTQVQEWKNILIHSCDAEQFTKYAEGFINSEGIIQKYIVAALALQKEEGVPTNIDIQLKHGENSSLLVSVANMSKQLAEIIGNVRSSANALSSPSEEMNATQSLTKGTSVQAASVQALRLQNPRPIFRLTRV